jgi:hypothetical protein
MSKENDNRLADKAYLWCRGETVLATVDERGNSKEFKGVEPYAPAVGSLLNLLIEVRDEERERCAKIVEDWATSSFPGSEDALISRGNAMRLIEEKIRST